LEDTVKEQLQVAANHDFYKLEEHYKNMLNHFADHTVQEAKLLASCDVDAAAEYFGIDLSAMTVADLFTLLPYFVEYQEKYEEAKAPINLDPYLEK
jgi:hypothetical protein